MWKWVPWKVMGRPEDVTAVGFHLSLLHAHIKCLTWPWNLEKGKLTEQWPYKTEITQATYSGKNYKWDGLLKQVKSGVPKQWHIKTRSIHFWCHWTPTRKHQTLHKPQIDIYHLPINSYADQLTWRKQLPGAAKIRRVLDNTVSSHCFIIMKQLPIIKTSKNIKILWK